MGLGQGWHGLSASSSPRTFYLVRRHKSLRDEGYKPHFSDEENDAGKDDLLKVSSEEIQIRAL